MAQNSFFPDKEHFTHDSSHAVQDTDAALKRALPTELRTYKLTGRKGSSSHHVNLIDEEIDCVTEGENIGEEPASEFMLQINKVSSPLNETTNGSSTFNITEIAMHNDEDGVESSFGPASVDVKGYRVRPEIAPILHQILEQHGDIAQDCKLVKVLKGCLLEKVCHVHEKLHNSSGNEIQRKELFENLGFNLQWLSDKVVEILEVKLFLNDFAKKRKELKKVNDQLATLRKAMAPIEQKQSDLEEELKKMMNKSEIQKVHNLYRNPLI